MNTYIKNMGLVIALGFSAVHAMDGGSGERYIKTDIDRKIATRRIGINTPMGLGDKKTPFIVLIANMLAKLSPASFADDTDPWEWFDAHLMTLDMLIAYAKSNDELAQIIRVYSEARLTPEQHMRVLRKILESLLTSEEGERRFRLDMAVFLLNKEEISIENTFCEYSRELALGVWNDVLVLVHRDRAFFQKMADVVIAKAESHRNKEFGADVAGKVRAAAESSGSCTKPCCKRRK